MTKHSYIRNINFILLANDLYYIQNKKKVSIRSKASLLDEINLSKYTHEVMPKLKNILVNVSFTYHRDIIYISSDSFII